MLLSSTSLVGQHQVGRLETPGMESTADYSGPTMQPNKRRIYWLLVERTSTVVPTSAACDLTWIPFCLRCAGQPLCPANLGRRKIGPSCFTILVQKFPWFGC